MSLEGAERWPRRSCRLPAGLIGMLALVFGAEVYVARHDRDFSNVWVQPWKLSGESARRAARRFDVLCFGDSLVMHGLVPQVLSESLGRPALNLAVAKGQMATSYFLLRRALESGARPAAVLVDGELLADDPLAQARLWPELATLTECGELAVAGRDASFLASMVLAKLCASYRDRYEIQASVLAALRGEKGSSRWPLRFHRRNQVTNLGAQVLPVKRPMPGSETHLSEPVIRYFAAPWSCHPINRKYVEKFLSLATSRQIPVFWLLPPLDPELQSRRDASLRDASYSAFLSGLQARYRNVIVLDGRHSGYGAEALSDATHLNRQGAGVFSLEVGRILRQSLAMRAPNIDRWIRLSAYRDQTPTARVEDLDESILALRRSAARR